MSRAIVRAVLTAFLQPPAVAGLNVMLSAQPRDLSDHSYTEGAGPGVSSGAIGVAVIENMHEAVQTMDGRGGGRETTYTAAVQVFHASVEPKAEDAMAAFDAVVDAICQRLRTDPMLGQTLAAANAAGWISGAHQSLSVEYGEPTQGQADSGEILTWAVIRFPVIEWNQPT